MDVNDAINQLAPIEAQQAIHRALDQARSQKRSSKLHRTYAPVPPDIWYEKEYRAFQGASSDAKTLWLYLLTCPSSNIVGVFRATAESVQADLRSMSTKDLRSAIQELCENGLIVWDEEERYFYVRHAFPMNNVTTNGRLNANQLKHAERVLSGLPDSAAKRAFLRDYENQENLNLVHSNYSPIG